MQSALSSDDWMVVKIPLPQTGQLAWGAPLNAEILADEATISTNSANIANHANNSPADPHGDRAYAQSLVTPITTGTNQPNGYVVLTSQGKIPLALVPTGAGLSGWVDAIPDLVLTPGTDISLSLTAGIQALSNSGGGIMYVGPGSFNIANPIIMYPNVWLMLSPGTIFNRTLTTVAPPAMIQNYSSLISPSGGNMWISGGTWNVANLAKTGVCFSFCNAAFINIRDMQIVGYPDGKAPIGRFFGCTDVNLDNIRVTAASPINSGRGFQSWPMIQVDELNVSNIPGLPSGVYLSQECVNVHIRSCSLSAGTLSDSLGVYTAWSSFCGSVGTIVSGNSHININVIEGCYASGLAVSAVQVINWQNLNCTGCQFTYPGSPYQATWIGLPAQISSFLFDVNSPRSYPPTTVASCSNTLTETIIAQFTIPANDWIAGTTCYRHRHTGIISSASLTDTVTINLRVGTTGTITDTLVETITLTIQASQTNVPYAIHHRGFDIDPGGVFNSAGFEVISTAFTVTETVTITNSVRITPTAGQKLFVSHTCQWAHARSGNTCQAKAGVHERANQ